MTAAPPEQLTLAHVATPIGPALLLADRTGRLAGFDFENRTDHLLTRMRRSWGPDAIVEGAAPAALCQALDAYFTGELQTLDTIDCVLRGTPFQQRVWAALRKIPAGQTTTYAALAERIGAARAVRATGAANGANPIAVVIPCHRVIGSGGGLTGYGGGLERKRWLLEHEGALSPLPVTARAGERNRPR